MLCVEWLGEAERHGSHARQPGDGETHGIAKFFEINVKAVFTELEALSLEHVPCIDEKYRSELAGILDEWQWEYQLCAEFNFHVAAKRVAIGINILKKLLQGICRRARSERTVLELSLIHI